MPCLRNRVKHPGDMRAKRERRPCDVLQSVGRWRDPQLRPSISSDLRIHMCFPELCQHVKNSLRANSVRLDCTFDPQRCSRDPTLSNRCAEQ